MKMDNIARLKRKIEGIIEKSLVPEDPLHAQNTLEWLLKLKPDADEALKIAALGHDIERAIAERKVKRQDYKNYDEFKEAHALNSAKILAETMLGYNLSKELVDKVFFLVCQHETGGAREGDVLRNADVLSFFQVNLPYYFSRNSVVETKHRCGWGYKKLPAKLKRVVAGFDYQNKELASLVRHCLTDNK